jgi:hypothetical protein
LLLFLISKRRRPQKELYALTYGQTWREFLPDTAWRSPLVWISHIWL